MKIEIVEEKDGSWTVYAGSLAFKGLGPAHACEVAKRIIRDYLPSTVDFTFCKCHVGRIADLEERPAGLYHKACGRRMRGT